jgi:hypothetical protein
VTALARFAKSVGTTDEAWQRHANPWSVYTRFAAIPAGILAIWSRTWFGWWALVRVGLDIVWLWLNPHIFPAVKEPRSWAARDIYGEKLWLRLFGFTDMLRVAMSSIMRCHRLSSSRTAQAPPAHHYAPPGRRRIEPDPAG